MTAARDTTTVRQALRTMPAGIWALGLASMLMDISSELVHGLLPIYMATVLGASMVTIGIVEGVAEATAAIVKVFSGALSDRWGKRKPLVVLGYGLSALSKPMFPLAGTLAWVAAARFIDRIGKGIRGAPRDALVADITPRHLRGAAYGLRQALDSIGAFVGPLLAIVLMAWLASDITAVLWVAVLPAVAAVLLLVVAVREPDHVAAGAAARPALHWRSARALSTRYWLIVGLGSVFTLARFSDAFLVLRGQQIGLPIAWVPVVMIVMNLVYAAAAYPAGNAADRIPARRLLQAGLATLVVADLVLAGATSIAGVLAGAALWGLHMALTQGLLSKLVADTAPADLRGTAFGVFNLVTGVAVLLASTIAGVAWSAFGPSATFLAGAVFAAVALAGVLLVRPPPAATAA